jgi:predicted AAA+ superfamily ATPase
MRMSLEKLMQMCWYKAEPSSSTEIADLFSIVDHSQADPNGFLAGLNSLVTLDEIQHVPKLFSVIKAAIDRNRQPRRFLCCRDSSELYL